MLFDFFRRNKTKEEEVIVVPKHKKFVPELTEEQKQREYNYHHSPVREVFIEKGNDFCFNTPPDIQKIVFTDELPKFYHDPFDLSEARDGSVLAWLDYSEPLRTMYVSSCIKDCKIMANRKCTQMFYSKEELREIDFSNFCTDNVEIMTDMFHACMKLRSLDLSGFNVSKVRMMDSLFRKCINLRYLDISTWNTENCSYYDFMFQRCEALRTVDISHFNSEKAYSCQMMFSYMRRCKLINLGHFDCSPTPFELTNKRTTRKRPNISDIFVVSPELTTLISDCPTFVNAYLSDYSAGKDKPKNVINPDEPNIINSKIPDWQPDRLITTKNIGMETRGHEFFQ
jgi:surface protein